MDWPLAYFYFPIFLSVISDYHTGSENSFHLCFKDFFAIHYSSDDVTKNNRLFHILIFNFRFSSSKDMNFSPTYQHILCIIFKKTAFFVNFETQTAKKWEQLSIDSLEDSEKNCGNSE